MTINTWLFSIIDLSWRISNGDGFTGSKCNDNTAYGVTVSVAQTGWTRPGEIVVSNLKPVGILTLLVLDMR